jgi:transcriptional regulator
MYLPKEHADLHLPTLYQFINDNPLGLLTTAIPSPVHRFIQASHIPFLVDPPSEIREYASTTGEPEDLGKIRGHMARSNPQTKAMIDSVTKDETEGRGEDDEPRKLTQEVMILFNGPAHHYVSAKFYTQTKPDTGKVVSTWNYSAVQVYGTATIYFSKHPSTRQFLDKAVVDLTKHAEEGIMGYDGKEGRPTPWTVDEAPEPFTNLLKKTIIGIEIKIDRIEGKFKMSQEMRAGDRDGVAESFKALGTAVGDKMAEAVEERKRVGELRERQKKGCPV